MRRILTILAAALSFTLIGQEPPGTYTWVATGSLQTARQSACAVSLKNGSVLVAGGLGLDGALASTEIYGPDGEFVPGAPMADARSGHTCTVLNDGRVLVTGGRRDGLALASAEVYDPESKTWETIQAAGEARWGHTATLLSDGRVLLAAGGTDGGATNLLEVFDPATGAIESLPFRLREGKFQHAAALLSQGRVLVVGGYNGSSYLDTAEIVNLPLGMVQPAAPIRGARELASAITLLNGQVLVAGGRNPAELGTSALYLADEDRWIEGPPMQKPRAEHAALRIPNNGNVLLIGGSASGQPLASTELFDAVTFSFSEVGSLTAPRANIAAAAQGDGGVILAIGGLGVQGPTAACGVIKAPRLSSDRTFYTEGLSQSLTGSGFRQAESVIFTVTRTSIVEPPSSFSAPGTVALGTSGLVSTTVPPQNPGSSVTVTARGVTSGLTASATYPIKTATSTSVSITPASPLAGTDVTIVARVGPTTRLNHIDGFADFRFGNTVLGLIPLGQNSAGAFSFSASDIAFFTLSTRLTAETNNLRATFFGSDLYGSSADVLRLTVAKQTPAITVSSPTSPVRLGNPWFLRTKITGDTASPSGSVGIFEGITSIPADFPEQTFQPGSIDRSTVVHLPGSPGNRVFRFSYVGNDSYLPGSVTIPANVQRSTLTGILFGGGPLAQFDLGQQPSFDAFFDFFFVGQNRPTGTVTWSLDDVNVLAVPVANGTFTGGPVQGRLQVTSQLTMRKPGSALLRAAYSGDANYEPATLGPMTVNVKKLNPTITVASELHNNGGNQFSSLTITVTPPSLSLTIGITPPVPTGFVTVGGFTFNLRPAPDGRSAVATGDIGSIANHTAVYPGDSSYNSVQKAF